jgi:hypothetical protein
MYSSKDQLYRMDARNYKNKEDGTTSNTISVQEQQQQQLPLISISSNQLQRTNAPPQYGGCGTEEFATLPEEKDDVWIVQSDDDDDDTVMTNDEVLLSTPPPPPPPPSPQLMKFHSFSNLSIPLFVVGSVPHSVLVATTIGIACGVSAYLYNLILQYGLQVVWKTWSQRLLTWILRLLQSSSQDGIATDDTMTTLPEWTVLWIPIVAIVLSIGLGYTVRYVGEPGDLASTIQCVHSHGWIELNHALPMTLASLFSIIAGASVGPEAALVAICATLAGFISQSIFGIHPKTQRNLVRKHTLMGVCLFKT